ncbi:hypothetical protein TYRP_000492 [Tyrophagus putrescentiae]|nr:hypothetical protein TYRP_000492 [Tyrophagus putrescentiae]
MAQGKLKVKAKLPAKAKASSVHRGNSNLKKSRVSKKKANAPSLQIKLQNEVTKEIRKNIEEQARGAASKFGETTKMDRKKK